MPTFGADGWLIGVQFMVEFIVIRGDLLGKPANIKVENNGAVVFCWNLPDRAQSFGFCSQFGQQVQNDRNVIERCARSGPKMSYYP